MRLKPNLKIETRNSRCIFDSNNCRFITDFRQDLLRRQDVLEKSHRRQLMTEIKKKQALKKQVQSANEKIYALEKTVKVVMICTIFCKDSCRFLGKGEAGAQT